MAGWTCGKNWGFRTGLAVAAAATAGIAAQAGAQPAISVENIVEKQLADAADPVDAPARFGPPEVVVPGDRLRISLRYRSNAAVPVPQLTLTNPLGDMLRFDGPAAAPGMTVSVDGGKNWGNLWELKITGADGAERAATAADVNNVRWVVAEPVQPGGSGAVQFFARVK